MLYVSIVLSEILLRQRDSTTNCAFPGGLCKFDVGALDDLCPLGAKKNLEAYKKAKEGGGVGVKNGPEMPCAPEDSIKSHVEIKCIKSRSA